MEVCWADTGLVPSMDLRGDGASEWSFTVSDAEAYDVAAVCAELADAVVLLSQGIRNAEDARRDLEMRGLGELLADRSEIMAGLLRHGVRFEVVVEHWRTLGADRPIQDRIDAFRFAGAFATVAPFPFDELDSVLQGEIDFDDVRAVGVGTLREHRKIRYFGTMLTLARRGAYGYSIEAVRGLAVKLDAEENARALVPDVVQFAELVGPEVTVGLPTLPAAASAYRALLRDGKVPTLDKPKRALYFARFMAGAGPEAEAAREFYEAGIPVETAIVVHASGGGAEQAAAAERGDVAVRLSGGYL